MVCSKWGVIITTLKSNSSNCYLGGRRGAGGGVWGGDLGTEGVKGHGNMAI